MVDPTVVADPLSPLPTPNSISCSTADLDSLQIPPLDPLFFSQDFTFPHNYDANPNAFLSFDENDVVDGDFDFDLTFDDLDLPSNSDDCVYSLDPPPASDPVQIAIDSDSYCFDRAVREPELRHVSIDQAFAGAMVSKSMSPVFCQFSGDQSSSATDLIPELHQVSDDRTSGTIRAPNSPSRESCELPGDQMSDDVFKLLNVPSPESSGDNRRPSQSHGNNVSNASGASNCLSLDSETCDLEVLGPASSQGSGDCGSNASENLNYSSPDSGNFSRSVNSSPDSVNNSKSSFVDQKIKLEGVGNNGLLKRKKENEDVHSEPRTSKYQRSNAVNGNNNGSNPMSEEEEKRKARLMRNRESAQLSRQRKKHYVEELEDKVRTMHSTIQDLNSKISYIMTENASLRQQVGNNTGYPPPGMYPPPHPQMVYPWMPCPPYMVKPQGSQVPLVPIPRLKPQPALAPKAKKVESKKTESKTKKVASVSFVGLLFFILLFGGLVPMVNLKYGGMREEFTGTINYAGSGFHEHPHERVLSANSYLNGTDLNLRLERNHASNIHCAGGHIGRAESNTERGSFGHLGNGSEPLIASLYVPRNDKLVKIDGNLIIHSVLASEKAMASRENSHVRSDRETGLAVPGDLAPAIPGRHPHLYRGPTERQRALSTGSADGENLKSTTADGKLQQWFREGLAGPMLSSGMCTEVFQFDVSPASASGAIVPATSARNISAEHGKNSTHLNKGRNRRILHGLRIPFAGSSHNITEEHVGYSEEGDLHGNNSVSSMVVSVLVDPREAGDTSDGDGMMGPRSLSRIFVVVLLDSVKYVTYSCMLPFKGSASHLVTT